MKKLLCILIIACLVVLGTYTSSLAGNNFFGKVGKQFKAAIPTALVVGAVNRLVQSEKNRNRRHDAANRNGEDIKRAEKNVQIQRIKDDYAKEKKIEDVKFSYDLKREKERQEQAYAYDHRDYGKETPDEEDGCGLDDEYYACILITPKRFQVGDETFASFEKAQKHAEQVYGHEERSHVFLANRYGIEGQKGLSFETYEQAEDHVRNVMFHGKKVLVTEQEVEKLD